MTKNTIHFTKPIIKGLPAPETKYIEYCDDTTRGLRLRITPTETKSFYLLRKFKGKTERVLIGRFPDTSVEKAKKRASQIHADMDAGINPNDSKRQFRDELTLNELFEIYLERHAKPHNRRPDETQYRYKTYIKPFLGNKKLSEITKDDVIKLQVKLADKGSKSNANKMHTLLRSIFNRAQDWDIWHSGNPTDGIKKFKEKPRNRLITPDDLEKIFESLKDESNQLIRDFFMILLLTGARRGNAQSMKWGDINLEAGIWVIPMTKIGESQTIPLVPQSLAILSQRKEKAESEYVFPGTGKTGFLMSPKKAWKRILDRVGLTDLRMHDLRHAFGSYLAATGANQFVIRDAMGHKNIGTSSRYVQIGHEVIRNSIQNAADAMTKEAGELIPLADVLEFPESKVKRKK